MMAGLLLTLKCQGSESSIDQPTIFDTCISPVETTSLPLLNAAFRMPHGMVNSSVVVPDSVDQNVKSGQAVMGACLGRKSQVLGMQVVMLQIDYEGDSPPLRYKHDSFGSPDLRNIESYRPWLYKVLQETNFVLEHEHLLSDSNYTPVRFKLR